MKWKTKVFSASPFPLCLRLSFCHSSTVSNSSSYTQILSVITDNSQHLKHT